MSPSRNDDYGVPGLVWLHGFTDVSQIEEGKKEE